MFDGDWASAFKKKSNDKVEIGQAERMAVIWSDTTASASGMPNQRGFGGRIYFYDKKGEPIRVDGELSVYAFDDTNGDEKTAADRVYKFLQADWQEHFSETQLGPSYSVWLPWDPVGGDRKTIALMPVFKSADNQIVKSGQSINVLQGKNPPILAEESAVPFRVLGSSPSVANYSRGSVAAKANYGVQLVANTEDSRLDDNANRDRTTTIDLPKQMQRRLNQDLASGSVDNVSPGTSVSFGPRTSPAALGGSDSVTGGRSEMGVSEFTPDRTAASSIPDSLTRPRSRAVFGAPGALK